MSDGEGKNHMLKVTCVNCGKHYRVKDKFRDKTLKCPECGTPIRVEDSGGDTEPDEKDMRQELMRLAGGEDSGSESGGESETNESSAPPDDSPPDDSPSDGSPAQPPPEPQQPATDPTTTVVDVHEARRNYTPLIVTVIMLAVLAGGGALGYSRYRSHRAKQQREKEQNRETVIEAIEEAREFGDAPCNREEAIGAWKEVNSVARDYENQYGDGDFVDAISESGDRIERLRNNKRRRAELIDEMRKLLKQARSDVDNEDYEDAQARLKTVTEAADKMECPTEESETLLADAREMLETDEIKHGGRGWVLYDGEWISPEEKEELQQQAHAEEMREKGLVQYKDQWVEPEEKERREEEEKRQRERQKQLAEIRGKIEEQLQEKDPEVLLDAPFQPLRWTNENWANTSDITIEEGEEDERLISCTPEKGSKDKWALSLQQQCDIRDYDELQVDVASPEKVKLALGVWTLPDHKLFESRIKEVKTDDGPETLKFDLQHEDFKSKESDWRHNTAIVDPARVYKLSLLFYSRPAEPIQFRNVRLVREEKEEETGKEKEEETGEEKEE